MNDIKRHRYSLTVITIATLGLTVESVLESWEFWVIPLLLIGILCLWGLHISQALPEKARDAIYLGFSMFATLFHGVHATSFFDVCSIITLMLALFSLYDWINALNLILAEYFILMLYQFVFLIRPDSFVFDSLNISRVCLQIVVVISVYSVCRKSVGNRIEQAGILKKREEDIISYDNDMEDFLSNISHELRTPVNVVNGMSTLLLKQGAGEEVNAIRGAGLRLSNQIEDIQDYTEVKRESLVLEEENYMITSLINDVATDFRRYTDTDAPELIIDLDPAVPVMMRGDVRKIKKILRHLLLNASKFTRNGGIYLRIVTTEKKYGVNLLIEVTDTGIGMKRRDIAMAAAGLYQANKKRNRSSGGIGLGLAIVYGMAHKMGGFIKIESVRKKGTTVRLTIPQAVVDNSPCLTTSPQSEGDVIFHVRVEKYSVPAVRDFHRQMAMNLAAAINRPLYSADNTREVKHLMESLRVSHIFMGEEEYAAGQAFFDDLSRGETVVVVSARPGFRTGMESRVIVLPKPLYGYPIVKVLNGEQLTAEDVGSVEHGRLSFDGVRALIVDDEPMNLVVACGMFGDDYGMRTDTASSGREALEKYAKADYDIIFMDHMMPEMDGVEAMKLLRQAAQRDGRTIRVVALTANAVSGAREMFINEGFDGFIAKPIEVSEFERVMKRVLPEDKISYRNARA